MNDLTIEIKINDSEKTYYIPNLRYESNIGETLSQFVNLNYNDFIYYFSSEAVIFLGNCKENIFMLSNENHKYLQDKFKMLLHYCFDDKFLLDIGVDEKHLKEFKPLFPPNKRYLYFLRKYPDFEGNLDTQYSIRPLFYAFDDKSIDLKNSSEILKNITDKKLLSHLKFKSAYKETISFKNIESLLYLEFIKVLQYDIPLRKCKNCGKYFVAPGRSDTSYCTWTDMPYEKTCREIGSQNIYNKKIQDNDYLKSFNKIYKRLYARNIKNLISKETFALWSQKARILRDEIINSDSKISIEDFEKRLEDLLLLLT